MREKRTGWACQYDGFSFMLHGQLRTVHWLAFLKNSATILFKYMDKVQYQIVLHKRRIGGNICSHLLACATDRPTRILVMYYAPFCGNQLYYKFTQVNF
jgi:hypothetical protein